ncbi:MAG: YegP family protein, partial [Enterobacterales bacterium]|nr:YegP family protein [Enterobacterales bacterium]
MAIGYYEIKKAKNGQFHFNLKASNGEIILSSEMYASKASADNGIASVQSNSPDEAQFE